MYRITIEINRLRLHACHGVMEQERTVGNEFEVSMRLEYPASGAVDSDRLESTLNYAEVCDEIRHVMSTPSALLEHACGRLYEALTKRFPLIEHGSIKIAKTNPPIAGTQLDSVAVELTW